MRVCQAMGLYKGLPTPFYYGRNSSGINIRRIRGQNPRSWTISHDEWTTILRSIDEAQNETFSLAETAHEDANPQSLYNIVKDAIRNKPGLDDSLIAYICAILVNEGSLLHYHGKTATLDARNVLRRSDPNADPDGF